LSPKFGFLFLPKIRTFHQNLDFWTKFRCLTKIVIHAQNFDLCPRISIFVQNFDFCPKFRFLSKREMYFFQSRMLFLYACHIFTLQIGQKKWKDIKIKKYKKPNKYFKKLSFNVNASFCRFLHFSFNLFNLGFKEKKLGDLRFQEFF